MTEARIAHTVPSIDGARVFLAQARRFAADARAAGVSDTGQQLLLYQACLAACDAALAAAGMHVQGDEGGHVLRLAETVRLLALEDDLRDALDVARRVRGGSAYRAGLVIAQEVDQTRDAAERLIAAVDRFVEESEH